MARRPLSERLATERERIAKLQENVRRLEAQERKTERAKDTRRKVLLGALVMNELERDTDMATELRRWLAERLPDYLTRDHDRDVMARFMGDGGAGERGSRDGGKGTGTGTGSAGDVTNDGGGDGILSAPSPASDRGGYDDGR